MKYRYFRQERHFTNHLKFVLKPTLKMVRTIVGKHGNTFDYPFDETLWINDQVGITRPLNSSGEGVGNTFSERVFQTFMATKDRLLNKKFELYTS